MDDWVKTNTGLFWVTFKIVSATGAIGTGLLSNDKKLLIDWLIIGVEIGTLS